MSKVELFKSLSNYKELKKIDDKISTSLTELYHNNHWKLKVLFKDYKKHCDELGKTCKNAWENNVMLLDYNWNNNDNKKKIINEISLNKLESGEYKSLYTNDQKANNIKTDAGYANRIQFFIKTFSNFTKYIDQDNLSWVAINNRELLLEIFKYHNDNRRSLATINKDIKTLVRVIKLLVGEESELRYKMSALQVAFTELENNRDDDNMIVTENEKRQFIKYDKLLEILDTLQKDYTTEINKLLKKDRKNGMKHNNDIYNKHQIILALALNILDYPSRHEKYSMDIIYDVNNIKESNYILFKKLKNNKVSKIIKFIFNENVKNHKGITYKLDSTHIKDYNKKLARLIKYSLDTYPRPYLFIGKDNWQKQNFSKASFNTICDMLRQVSNEKNICIDGFRSAFVSYYYPTSSNKHKEIIKTRMRTSRDVIERFYLKYESEDKKIEDINDVIINKEIKEIKIEEKPNTNDISLAEKKRLNYKKWYDANKEKKLAYNHKHNINPKTKQRNILNDLNMGKTVLSNYKKETINKYKIYETNSKFYGDELIL
tara:strand:+ start:283 stop:1917 length:1635 start_codon:yes stop_codon:yes gene_type:complete